MRKDIEINAEGTMLRGWFYTPESASGKVPGMAIWRERLFAAMHLNANLPAAYFGVPTGQVVEMGLEVEI